MQSITEKTVLPISMIVLVGGAIWWASSLSSKVEAHDQKFTVLERIESRIDTMAVDIAEIKRSDHGRR